MTRSSAPNLVDQFGDTCATCLVASPTMNGTQARQLTGGHIGKAFSLTLDGGRFEVCGNLLAVAHYGKDTDPEAPHDKTTRVTLRLGQDLITLHLTGDETVELR